VRGRDNVLKRVLVQAAAFNMGLLLRKWSGWGKPRQAQGRRIALTALRFAVSIVQGGYSAVQNWLDKSVRNLFLQITAAVGRQEIPQ
jgi:hypothetical protein